MPGSRLLAVTLIFLLIPIRGLLAGEVAILNVRYRPAEELLPLVQMLLDPQDTIVASGSRLIVRANPARLEEVRAVLSQLDQPPRRLMITVSRQTGATAEGAGIGMEAGIGGSGVTVRGRGGVYRDSRAGQGVQQVQTLEGQAAVIRTGTLIPLPNGYGGIQYQPVTEGFSATPRVSGDRVSVDIAPWYEGMGQPGIPVISTESAATSVSGRLGEWIGIGGVSQSTQTESVGLLGGGRAERSSGSRLYLKVEDLETPPR